MVTALTAVITALLIFILPGAVVGWCAGMRLPWAVSTGVVITAGVWGVLAWWYGNHNIAVTFDSLIKGTAVFAAVGLVWRIGYSLISALRGRRKRQLERELLSPAELDNQRKWWSREQLRAWFRSPNRHGGVLDPMWILPLAGVVTGFTLLTQRAMDAIEGSEDGLDSIFQGWDVHWHASVLRFIHETGVASSIRMGELQNIETQKPLFYPTGFHTFGAALQDYADLTPVEALNVTSVVLPAVSLALSAAFLAWVMVGRRGLTGALAAGLAPVAVVGVIPVFYVEYYTGAWPNASALSMVGIAAAALMKVPERPKMIPAAALGFAGVGAVHPSAIPVVAVIVALWWLLWKLFVPTGREQGKRGFFRGVWLRCKDVLLIGVTAIAGGALMLPQWMVGSGQASEVSAFNKRQVPDYGDAWQRVFELQSRANHYAPTQWWVTWGAIAGAVVLLLWRRNIWAAAATGLLAAVGAYSLKNFDGPAGAVAGFLSGLNYNSAHRLFHPLALVATALAAVAAAAVVRFVLGGFLDIPFLRKRRDAKGRRKGIQWVSVIPATLATATCIGIAFGLVPWTQAPMEGKYRWAVTASRDGRMVGEKEKGAFEWLKRQPGAYDGIIANNSHEGTGWMYPLHNLPSLHRHFLLAKTPKDSATQALLWHPDIIGAGLSPVRGSEAETMRQWSPDTAGVKGDRSDYANISDFAARDLNVKYYIISPPAFFASQKNIEAQVKGMWKAPGLTPVYKDGATAIFAVNAQLTDEELAKARESGEAESPDKLPPLPKVKSDGEDAATGAGAQADPSGIDPQGAGASGAGERGRKKSAEKSAKEQKFHRPTKWDRDLAKEDAAAGGREHSAPGEPQDPKDPSARGTQRNPAVPTPGQPDAPHGPGAVAPQTPGTGPAQAPVPAPVPAAPYAPAPQAPVAPAYPGWQAPPAGDPGLAPGADPGYGVPGAGIGAPALGQGLGF
ncbi:DUF6541 family protein [Corynebacterium resistens]|uniref:DUF6541 family protein n=1 Tax=Corynebacterium resistens TaxID=258224 RepID=UPI0001E29AD1|nr:DUF6541 family protein [Corynebacterium resistens]